MQKKESTLTTNRFVGQGMLFFTNQILISVTNWFYWIIVSRLASTSEIGQATSVYSLVFLIATISTLGLEYPLLKKSSLHRSQILGIALTIELIITSGSIVVIIFLANVYQTFLNGYILVAIAMLVLSPISFTARFALLGTLNARAVLVLDIIGTGAKFLAAYILLSIGFGALGILLSFMIATLVTAITMTSIARRRLPLKLVRDKSHIIEVLKEGLSNMPSKLSRTMITTLSVILLASYGISDSDIGIFYIALMISVVGAGVASSMAITVIPASTESKADLSSGSLRFGLSLTAPIVTGLIVAPKDILSILGSEYASADTILLVLSVAILPTAVISNAIAKFNNLGHDRKIIAIGIIQIAVFLTFLLILVPHYGSLGAAYSILISYTTSAAMAVLFWFERVERKYIANCVAAVIIGWISGYTINFMLDNSIPAIVLSVMATSVVLLALKNTSVSELRVIIRSINKSEAGQPHKKRSSQSE
jgi:O-antigen/teichoic acid export membrane protein